MDASCWVCARYCPSVCCGPPVLGQWNKQPHCVRGGAHGAGLPVVSCLITKEKLASACVDERQERPLAALWSRVLFGTLALCHRPTRCSTHDRVSIRDDPHQSAVDDGVHDTARVFGAVVAVGHPSKQDTGGRGAANVAVRPVGRAQQRLSGEAGLRSTGTLEAEAVSQRTRQGMQNVGSRHRCALSRLWFSGSLVTNRRDRSGLNTRVSTCRGGAATHGHRGQDHDTGCKSAALRVHGVSMARLGPVGVP